MTNSSNDGKKTTIAERLAAEGQRGFSTDPHDNPVKFVKLIGEKGDDALDQKSKWHRPEAEVGDFAFSTGLTVAGADGFIMQPVLYTRSWVEWPKGATKSSPVATWAKAPPDAYWIQGKGGGHFRGNGNSLSDKVEIDMLVDGDLNRMTFNGKDCRHAAAFHAEAKRQRILLDGRRQPASLFAGLWRVTSKVDEEIVVEKDNTETRQKKPKPVFTLAGMLGEPDGPDEDEVTRGSDLYESLVAELRYPNPTSIVPLRRAVGSDMSPPRPPPNNEAPPIGDESGDGPGQRDNDDLDATPNWVRKPPPRR